MISSTKNYLRLKEIYSSKAKSDFERFIAFVEDKEITLKEVQSFVKSILVLDYLEMRSLELERESPNPDNFIENDCGKWLVVMKSVDLFREKHSEFPSSQEQMAELYSIISNFLSLPAYQPFGPISFDFVKEMYEGKSAHAIDSIMGGVVSQEIVKMLSNQFLPLNNTFVFNGLKGEAAVLEM